MRSVWRLLALAAAVQVTLGVGTASAQRVMVRHLPVGTPVEIVLNGDAVGTGTVADDGDVTIPFVLPEKDGKAEMDANIHVDVCEKVRRVLIVDQSRSAPPPAEGCDRKEVSGLFWVRRVNTLVIDLAPSNPTVLLINGNYTPPRPRTPEEEAAGDESTPHAPLPKGFVMFAGGGQFSLRDFTTTFCGNVACSGGGTALGLHFGATYWITRNFGVEGSYFNPQTLKVSGGNGFAFDTGMRVDMWSVLGKAGVQAGAVRIYGQGGTNYHQSTVTTTETITAALQKIEFQTKGWNWVYGGGAEVWIKKVAIYGEFDVAWIKGNARAGGEAKIDDRARMFLTGIRLHVGG
jgi:hypothetical protein